ncbi:MAG: aminopeptidase P family protein [bacterium]|nr:aminopeptidase P family protein [bacterium]
MDDRRILLTSFLKEQRVDAILLSSPLSIKYYTGFHGFSHEEREGYALQTKNALYLLTSKLYEGSVQSLPGVTPLIYSQKNPFSKILQTLFKNENIQKLGVEENNLTLAEFRSLKKLIAIVPTQIRHLRMQKTADEIRSIKKACAIADRALAIVRPQIKTGITEKDIASLLENVIRKSHGEISFRPIVAFAENSAIPHHVSSDKKLKANDIILIDFGAKWEGYCSDMTRTFFHGKPTDEQKKVYETVLRAQQAAIDHLYHKLIYDTHSSKHPLKKPINASGVDNASRKYVVSKGYPAIPHSLGHGIGLEVHEPPYLGPGSKDILEEGMIFSIEPGIYLPGKFGVRIEDLFAIKNNAVVRLTNSSY